MIEFGANVVAPVPPLVTASADIRVNTPVLENDEVAVTPNEAYPADSPVVEALPFNNMSDVVADCPTAG